MIRIIHFRKNQPAPQTYPVEALPELLRRRDGITWIDLALEPPEASEPILRDQFGFHPLAVYDALHETHASKLDLWEEYAYLVMHGPYADNEDARNEPPPELDVFLGRNFLVTHHHVTLEAVDTVWEMCTKEARILQSGADHVLFRISLEILRAHFRMLEELEDRINLVEDRIFSRPDRGIPEELFAFKRILLEERSTVGPMREVFNQLALDSMPQVDSKDRVFFRDIYEQLNRLDGSVTHLRDLTSSTLDTYLSVVNNRMNETMRLMAVITTLFMPITFITGFFGMNFFQAAAPTGIWTSVPVLAIAVTGMLLVPIGMFVWMKRRGLI